jgi:hypothetical protein
MPLIRKDPDERMPLRPVEKTREPVCDALEHGKDEERWSAARDATPADIDALDRALTKEKDPRVREAIFTSLARFRSAQSLEVLLTHLRSDDANLRNGALDALLTMPEVAVPKLESLLSDPDPDVRLLTCEIVRTMPGPDATRLLCALLQTERAANVCAAAVDVLAEIGGPEALPVLARCADRFAGVAFLAFSIKTAQDSIGAPSDKRRD